MIPPKADAPKIDLVSVRTLLQLNRALVDLYELARHVDQLHNDVRWRELVRKAAERAGRVLYPISGGLDGTGSSDGNS